MSMMRAVVLKDGLGAIAWTLESCGVEVAALYTEDKMEERICMSNLKGNVILANPLELKNAEIPEADIIAGRLLYRHIQMGKGRPEKNPVLFRYSEIIEDKRPAALLFETSVKLAADMAFQKFLMKIQEFGYGIFSRQYDIQKTTGLPVHENRVYVVGLRNRSGEAFKFPELLCCKAYGLEEICRTEDVIDPWYFDLTEDFPIRTGDERKNTFFCWKSKEYVETETVYWNMMRTPLVRMDGVTRKVTHREMARLKGYPEEFNLEGGNKARLYKKLMYGPNIFVLRSVARAMLEAEGNPVFGYFMPKSPQELRERQLKRLLESYIQYKNMNGTLWNGEGSMEQDFLILRENQKIAVEIKLYTSNAGIESKIDRFCEERSHSSSFRSMMYYILIVGNYIHNDVKQLLLKKYGITIWDVRNLLWLFDEFPELKNKLISLLNFTTSDLIPERPEPDIFVRKPEEKREKTAADELGEKLKKIEPGREQSLLYEETCTEILKNILGDCLDRWERQQISNNGLYRFDLCCKIKHGVLPEFFDTVKNFFNTKYIVFEFKNYETPITQKEIYTTEKYLYQKALRGAAIIISRKGASENARAAAKGCLRENGKLILCLSDADLLEMLVLKEKGDQSAADRLADLLDEMLIHLEK